MVLKFLYVFIGGGLGALLRYLLSSIIQKQSSSLFPYGTLAVNLIGALLIGFLWEFFSGITVSTNMKILIFTGILGGLTTFSTFSLETFNLLSEKQYITALINVVAGNVFCIVLVFAGSIIARFLLKLFGRGNL
ncbi:MAG: fluoride efflux transporter CrcB [Actinobacteria bacterium]|nr:fluoride efflux transporter CrcB [Actinomycetota bacterium]